MFHHRLFNVFDGLMYSQWACPHGPLGWFAGKLMERGNAPMNGLAIEVLGVQPGHAVLELGFGPGAALEKIAGLAVDGFVAGVESSELMVRQVARRLREQIATGRVEVKPGSSSSIPYQDARFDRVLTVNTIYFWNDPEADFRELRRVTKQGGRLVVVLRAAREDVGTLKVHGMPRDTLVDEVAGWMRNAGFGDVSITTRNVPFGTMRVIGAALSAQAV